MARSFVAGSSQYGDTASTPISAYPFSMSVWVKTNAPSATQEAFAMSSSASNNPLAAIRVRGDLTDDIVEWLVRNNASTSGTPISSGPSGGAGGNVWTLVTCVATSVTSRSIFINGANKVTNTTDLTGAWSPTKLCCAALARTTVGNYSTIELAELAVWNAALSDAEVASLFVSSQTGKNPSEVLTGNCVGYWPFLGTTSPEPDSIGGIDFTLYNSPSQSTHPTINTTAGQPSRKRFGGVMFSGFQNQGISRW